MKKDRGKAKGWTTANGTLDIFYKRNGNDFMSFEEKRDIIKEQHAKK